jgi:tRNA pseudouridine38-40 synthase
MRIAAGVEYNGNKFHGWQSQVNVITLQSTLEEALSKLAAEPIKVVCAGRTDRGVHATNQVIHFDTTAKRKEIAWIYGTNAYLPSTISLQWMQEIDDSFHARFSALSRRYQYLIYNFPVRSSLFCANSTWVNQALDEQKMAQAAQYLVGEHDFSSFRSSNCQSKTACRYIHSLEIKRFGNLIILDIVANSFLHHMVRNIAGVLIDIGVGKQDQSWCQEVLLAKDRTLGGKTAPPQGLYLTGVRYSDQYNLPCDFKSPMILRDCYV